MNLKFVHVLVLVVYYIRVCLGQVYINGSTSLVSRYAAASVFLPTVGTIIVGGVQINPGCTAQMNGFMGDVWVIPPSSDTYIYKGVFPTSRIGDAGFTSVVMNGITMMLLCGGRTNTQATDILSCYRTSDGITFTSLNNGTALPLWTSPPDCPSMAGKMGWSHLSLASLGSTVYFTGGSTLETGCNYSLNPYVYKSIDGGENWVVVGDWRQSSGMQLRSCHGSIVNPLNGALYIIAGSGSSIGINLSPLNDIWVSKDSGVTFQLVAASAPFTAREYVNTFINNGLIHIIGGWDSYSTFYQDVWVATNIDANSWQDLTNPTNILDSRIDCFINGAVVDTSGSTPSVIVMAAAAAISKELVIRYDVEGDFGLKPSAGPPLGGSITTTTNGPTTLITTATVYPVTESPTPSILTISGSIAGVFLVVVVISLVVICVSRKSGDDKHKSSGNNTQATLDPAQWKDTDRFLGDKPSEVSSISKSNIDSAYKFHTTNEQGGLLSSDASQTNWGSNRNSLRVSGSLESNDVLKALSMRLNSSPRQRRRSRNAVASSFLNSEDINYIILNWMEQEEGIDMFELPLSLKEVSWLPEPTGDENDLSLFEVGAARAFQRTPFFTLIGDVISDSDTRAIRRGLVRPLNLLKNGKMEGVNAIVWQIAIGSKMCAMKGMLPLNNIRGYDNQFRNQEAEFNVPMSLPPHPHIVRMLHQFTGSSVLVYPWLSDKIIELNAVVKLQSGQRFVRRQTTYVVMDFYPSTLRKYLNNRKQRGEKLQEREMCFIALQLLEAVSHLSKHKVVHRDIKDDNIFMAEDGRLILGDFGCALMCEGRYYQKVANITNRIGFPAGIAPEVSLAIKDGPVPGNPRKLWDILCKNDVYAIGVLVKNLIKFSAATNNSSNASTDNSNSTNDSVSIVVEAEISSDFGEFVSRLLDPDPNNRFSPEQAKYHVSMLLWGPSSLSFDFSSWIFEKRLDLYFNTCQAESGENNEERIGRILPYNSTWPPIPGSLEHKLCTHFFRTIG